MGSFFHEVKGQLNFHPGGSAVLLFYARSKVAVNGWSSAAPYVCVYPGKILRKLIVIQASGVKACHNREDTRSVTEISE